MPMELTTLHYFVTIARTGHLTRAARELGVTQPTLSAMLKKLEAELKADLFDRTGRGVSLTAAGQAFLPHAEDALRRAQAAIAAVHQVTGLAAGSLRIGGGATATTYLLPPVISAIRKAHSGLRFYVREAGSNAVAAAVRSGELDLGIVTLPLPAVDEPELLTIPLIEDELRLIVPPKPGTELAHLQNATTFRWKDLEQISVVAFEAGTAVREMIDRASLAAGVRLSVVMELRSIESIKQMVTAGIGVGFISRIALKQGEGLSCKTGKLSRELAIVRRRDRLPSPAGQAFERRLLEQVKEQRGKNKG
jgi:DNA-binding transcriptional LysR family regulator